MLGCSFMQLFLKSRSVFILIFILCTTSCSKNENMLIYNTKVLLNAVVWRVIKRAADDNTNGKIEENEFKKLNSGEGITITFLTTGMGNEKIGNLFNLSFKWRVVNEKNIHPNFNVPRNSFDKWTIKKLTSKEFYLISNDVTNKWVYGFHCEAK